MSTHLKSLARRIAPAQIPVFPLTGTVLMPGCELPLNIFEPRYLNMIDDALHAQRLIGIIQPLQKTPQGESVKHANPQRPALTSIGTLGRIKQFSETDDGRYLISLVGLKRFTIIRDAEVNTPYRQTEVSYSAFKDDPNVFDITELPNAMTEDNAERSSLVAGMKQFAKSLGVQVDWSALGTIPMDRLVDQTVMISPFQPVDKQSLLEAATPTDRRRLLIGLMHLYASNLDEAATDSPVDTPRNRKDLQ